jgi:hypothetical protein
VVDVFISYKRRMRPQVAKIAAELRSHGVDVWYDAGIDAGSRFSAEIAKALRAAKCVLVCWTNDAFPHGGDQTGWVIAEASFGHDRGILVPVMLEPSDLDPPWNVLHTENLVSWAADPARPLHADEAWQRTLMAIGRKIGRFDLRVQQESAFELGLPASRPTTSLEVTLPSNRRGRAKLASGFNVPVAFLGCIGALLFVLALLLSGDLESPAGVLRVLIFTPLYALPMLFYLLSWGRYRVLIIFILAGAITGAHLISGAAVWLLSIVPLPSIFQSADASLNVPTTQIDPAVALAIGGAIGSGLSFWAFYSLLPNLQSRRRALIMIGSTALLSALAAAQANLIYHGNLRLTVGVLPGLIRWLTGQSTDSASFKMAEQFVLLYFPWQVAFSIALAWVLGRGRLVTKASS